jgi:hypothetical protein
VEIPITLGSTVTTLSLSNLIQSATVTAANANGSSNSLTAALQ